VLCEKKLRPLDDFNTEASVSIEIPFFAARETPSPPVYVGDSANIVDDLKYLSDPKESHRWTALPDVDRTGSISSMSCAVPGVTIVIVPSLCDKQAPLTGASTMRALDLNAPSPAHWVRGVRS
jgi:hypothetical protein